MAIQQLQLIDVTEITKDSGHVCGEAGCTCGEACACGPDSAC